MELSSENDSNETNKQKDETKSNSSRSDIDILNADYEKNLSSNNINNFDTKCQSLICRSEVEPLICNVDYENLSEKEATNSNSNFKSIRDKKVPLLRKLNSSDEIKPCVQFEKNSFDENDEFNSNENVNHSAKNMREGNTNSSSSDDEDSSADSEHVAPDGGYGWVVVFASFMINLIADGITFSFGLFYVEFLNYFGDSKGKTAWIGSIFMASPLILGPIASFLTDRYGCRRVTIIGSILSATGFILSAMSNSIEMLFINFGIVSGFGLSLCYVSAIVIVAFYFDTKRSFATGISVCGSGIGTFIFAPLIQYLISEYGWRGATLILAGIFLNMCVCGCLMKDLEWTSKSARLKREGKKKSIDTSSISNSTNTNTAGASNTLPNFEAQLLTCKLDELNDARLFSSLPDFLPIRNGEKLPPEILDMLAKNRNVNEIILQNYPHLLHSYSFNDPIPSGSGARSETREVMSPTTMNNSMCTANQVHRHTIQLGNAEPSPYISRRTHSHRIHRRNSHHHDEAAFLKDLKVHRHSLVHRMAMLNINRYRLRASSCPDIYRNSMTTIAKEKSAWTQTLTEFKKLVVDILDFSYFKEINFLLFAISNLILYTWYDLVYVYLPDYAIETENIDETDASMIISLIGIINMFGEILLGWAGDQNLNPTVIYSICMIFCGCSVLVVPFFTNYQSLCIISSIFGFTIASNYALTSIILVELITIERFTNAYGLLLLVQGVANLVGPPIAGWIYDLTGTYNLPFFLAGIFIILSGVLLLILPVINKIKKISNANKNNNSVITDERINNGKDKIAVNGKLYNECADV